MEFHHRRGGPVPVQYLAGRDADRVDRREPTPMRRTWGCSSRRPAAGISPGCGSTRTRITLARIPAACGLRPGRCWRRARSAVRPRSGWQELDFSAPVAVTAGTTYVASYFTSTGHYAAYYQRAGVGGDQWAADRAGRWRGVRLRPVEHVPHQHLNNINYWVDVVYSPTAGSTPPSVTSVAPGSGATGVAVSVAPSATFSQAGDAEHGVVHGEGFRREQRGRVGGFQRRGHGGDVHAE